MVIIRRDKKSRQRGHKTHGWGSKKKHRGAGNRGGRRNAGTGKRGDSKKPSIWKTNYFGKKGFDRKPSIRSGSVALNISDLEAFLPKFLSKGIAKQKSDFYEVDLSQTEYDKLLGNGKVLHKFKVKVDFASAKAKEKIRLKGGEVLLPGDSSGTDNANDEASKGVSQEQKESADSQES